MARTPRPKKSEALEIRVSHEEKQAFMEAVTKQGETASDVIREAMARFSKAPTDRSDRMPKRLIAGAAILGIAAISIGGWELIRSNDFGAAYADEITSNLQMRVVAEGGDTRQVFRTMTRIQISPGETGVLTFGNVSPDILQAILPDSGLTAGLMTVSVTLAELAESELYRFQIALSITDQDGIVHETPVSPSVATRIDSPAAIESRFGTDAEFMINVTPISLEPD